MSAPRLDLSGRTFGQLRVQEFHQMRARCAYWWCVCACSPGVWVSVRATRLLTSKTDHCGCLGYRRDPERHKTARAKVSPRKRREISRLGGEARATAYVV